jgi:hypothetical protein
VWRNGDSSSSPEYNAYSASLVEARNWLFPVHLSDELGLKGKEEKAWGKRAGLPLLNYKEMSSRTYEGRWRADKHTSCLGQMKHVGTDIGNYRRK